MGGVDERDRVDEFHFPPKIEKVFPPELDLMSNWRRAPFDDENDPRFIRFIAKDEFPIPDDYAVKLGEMSGAAMAVVSHRIRVKHKTQANTFGTAAVISEGEVAEVRRILKLDNVQAGDVIIQLDNDSPFFIQRSLFEDRYDVVLEGGE